MTLGSWVLLKTEVNPQLDTIGDNLILLWPHRKHYAICIINSQKHFLPDKVYSQYWQQNSPPNYSLSVWWAYKAPYNQIKLILTFFRWGETWNESVVPTVWGLHVRNLKVSSCLVFFFSKQIKQYISAWAQGLSTSYLVRLFNTLVLCSYKSCLGKNGLVISLVDLWQEVPKFWACEPLFQSKNKNLHTSCVIKLYP